MLKTYLDGSGKSDDPKSRFLTLASIFASDAVWKHFEERWAAVLAVHHVPYSHMADLVSGRGPFCGWSDTQRSALVIDLLNCLTHEERSSFIGSTTTLDLESYRRIANAAIKPAGAICVDSCMTHAFNHPDFFKGRAEVFFDKSEEFIHWIERIWTRNKSNASSWASYISTVAPADMKDVIGIQAADLLAWAANRYHVCDVVQDFWSLTHVNTIIAMPHYHRFLTEPEILRHPGLFSFLE